MKREIAAKLRDAKKAAKKEKKEKARAALKKNKMRKYKKAWGTLGIYKKKGLGIYKKLPPDLQERVEELLFPQVLFPQVKPNYARVLADLAMSIPRTAEISKSAHFPIGKSLMVSAKNCIFFFTPRVRNCAGLMN